MVYLIIAVLCSVSVSVLLKILRQKNMDIRQTIVAGYPVAFLLTWVLLKPDFGNINALSGSWSIILLLGVLLPAVFIMLGRAIESVGIITTDAAQRLSLIIPIIAAFALFNETLTMQRLLGIVLGFLALGALVYRRPQIKQNLTIHNKGEHQKNMSASHLVTKLPVGFWLLGVWIGYGVIDILFKQVAKQGAAFSLTLLMSFGLASILLLIYLWIKKVRWEPRALVAGLLLGGLNMANIYTYIKAHQALSESPSVVFTGMNVGVIAVATIIGVFVFKETLSKLNMLGIGLAIATVIVLFL